MRDSWDDVGIMLVPLLCGVLGQWAGMWIFPVYVLVFYAIMIPLTISVKRVTKQSKSNV